MGGSGSGKRKGSHKAFSTGRRQGTPNKKTIIKAGKDAAQRERNRAVWKSLFTPKLSHEGVDVSMSGSDPISPDVRTSAAVTTAGPGNLSQPTPRNSPIDEASASSSDDSGHRGAQPVTQQTLADFDDIFDDPELQENPVPVEELPIDEFDVDDPDVAEEQQSVESEYNGQIPSGYKNTHIPLMKYLEKVVEIAKSQFAKQDRSIKAKENKELQESWVRAKQPKRGSVNFMDYCRPELFYWRPDLYEDLCCPLCKNPGSQVVSKGWGNFPRRVMDLDRYFYCLVGRYECRSCRKSFSSSSQTLISSLSLGTQLRLPVIFSRRNALSRSVVDLLRASRTAKCSWHSIRSQLVEMHAVSYTRNVIRFLSEMQRLGQFNSNIIPPPEKHTGVFGTNISAAYLQTLYLRDFDRRSPHMHAKFELDDGQHLSADDSHKVSKNLKVHVEGEYLQLFDCLSSILNEDGKIVGQRLTISTATDQKEPMLAQIAKRYKNNGFAPILSFTTDNPGESEGQYVKYLPSIAKVPEHLAAATEMELPEFTFAPCTMQTYTQQTATAGLNNILSLLEENRITFGLSTQQAKANPGVDVLFLAYFHDETYTTAVFTQFTLWQRSAYLRLEALFLNQNSLFAGKSIRNQFKRLHITMNRRTQVQIQVTDVAMESKAKGFVNDAHAGIPLLLKTVLEKRLVRSYPGSLRDVNWKERHLSRDIFSSAAIDAYAALKIHEVILLRGQKFERFINSTALQRKFTLSPVGENMLFNLHTGASGGRVAAIAEFVPGEQVVQVGTNSIRLGIQKAAFKLTKVVVPGFQTPYSKSVRLENAGELVVWDPRNVSIHEIKATPTGTNDPGSTSSIDCEANDPGLFGASGVSTCNTTDAAASSSATSIHTDADSSSPKCCCTICSPPVLHGFGFLADAFHIIARRIPISRHHPAAFDFYQRLTGAVFVWRDISLFKELCQYLRDQNIDPEDYLKSNPNWFNKRCPRFIPQPEQLHASVKEVFDTFRNIVDPATDKELFSDKANTKAEAILQVIERGYLSDPVGYDFYRENGTDSAGFTLYRTHRGSNSNETMHLQLVRQLHMAAFSCGLREAEAHLTEFRHRYNIRVDRQNFGANFPFVGHYEYHLLETAHVLSFKLFSKPMYATLPLTQNFVNQDDLLGVVGPIQFKDKSKYSSMEDALQTDLNSSSFDWTSIYVKSGDLKPTVRWISKRLTPIAKPSQEPSQELSQELSLGLVEVGEDNVVLPSMPLFHKSEMAIFKKYVVNYVLDGGKEDADPDFDKMSHDWIKLCITYKKLKPDATDFEFGKQLFGKLPVQLKKHYKAYNSSVNRCAVHSTHRDKLEEIAKTIGDHQRSTQVSELQLGSLEDLPNYSFPLQIAPNVAQSLVEYANSIVEDEDDDVLPMQITGVNSSFGSTPGSDTSHLPIGCSQLQVSTARAQVSLALEIPSSAAGSVQNCQNHYSRKSSLTAKTTRGKDAKQRAPRRCGVCVSWECERSSTCNGRGSACNCPLNHARTKKRKRSN